MTGAIIYIWALPLIPTKLGILNNQCEKMIPPPNPAYTFGTEPILPIKRSFSIGIIIHFDGDDDGDGDRDRDGMCTEMIALHLFVIKYKMVRRNPVLKSILLKLLKNRLKRNVYQFDNVFLDFDEMSCQL